MKTFRLCIFFALAVALSSCNFSLAADVTPPPNYTPPAPQTQPPASTGPFYPMVAPDPANGAATYAEKCAPCHGDTGKGDGPRAAQLANPVAAIGSAELAHASTPAKWFRIVTEGNLEKFMPPFSSLSDRQRWDVVAYTYRLSSPESSIALGQELYAANCASCHGPGGQGDGPQAAGSFTRKVDFTDQEYMAQKSAVDFFTAITDGAPPAMPEFAGQLSEEERWAITDYLRSLAFAGAGQPIAQAGTPIPEAVLQDRTPSGTEAADTTEPVATTELTTTLGTIEGWVENGSGGEVPAGLNVTLFGFDQMQSVLTQTTTVQGDGTYEFTGVEMPLGRVYLTTVEYGRTDYGSDIVTVQPETNAMQLPIRIYESTVDISALVTERLHLFFEFIDEKTVRVIELFILSNNGDKTIVPAEEGQPTITFKLPEGASNLEFQEGVLGGRFVETSDGFGDTVPIRPGSNSYQVLYSYNMPYDRKLDLAQTMTVPVNAVVILAPAENVQVKGEGLQDAGKQDVEGVQYQLYSSQALQPGEELKLTVTGKPGVTAASLSPSTNTSLIVGIAGLGLALILAGIWLYQRSRQSSEDDDLDEDGIAPAVPENAEAVMDAILALDDQYQAGNLPEPAYRQRRAELKAQLEEFLKK